MGHGRQPRGANLLFFTGLWDRFGFTALQTVLVLYMTKSLGVADDRAFLLYGTFSSLFYLTPVIGGYLADRYLGLQRSIIMGGFLMMVGYLLCGLPETRFFLPALSVIIVGQGLFRPGTLGLADDLHGGDARRLSRLYTGVQYGALLPPLLAGHLSRNGGWYFGFLLAALGMAVGLLTFIMGRFRLRSVGALPVMSPLRGMGGEVLNFYSVFYVAVIGCVGAIMFLFHFPEETSFFLAVASMAMLMVCVLLKEKGIHKHQMTASIILILLSVGFWALYNQTFTALMLYADRHMEHRLLGLKIDAPFMLFFNPFFILVLSPLLGRLWIFSAQQKKMTTITTQLSLGILLMALGFFLPGIGGLCSESGKKLAAFWLAGGYFLQTLGELLVFPVGIAIIMRLAPKPLVENVMNLWFLSQAAACAIGGGLSTLVLSPTKTPLAAALMIDERAFFIYGGVALSLSILGFALVPFLNRLIEGQMKIPVSFH